jgi:ubiquinone/menaquinone biosynthesis C-methylase UbiE
MEALERALAEQSITPQAIIGLDIAEHMLARARQRLGARLPFEFLHYDGVTVPLPDQSLDLIYSVASLQHVPKPYVYNLFFEIKRLLSPTGFAVLHLLSFDQMIRRQNYAPWHREVARQVRNGPGMWVHFYTQEELNAVLSTGTAFAHVETLRLANGIWTCVAHKDPASSQ